MPGKRIIFYILAAFIAGNFLLIYIQYNSAKNITALIKGNEQLLRELKTTSSLKELEKDIITVDDKLHGTVAAGDFIGIEELERKIEEVETDIRQLQEISGNDSSVRYIDLLDRLVHKKLLFSRQILANGQRSGTGGNMPGMQNEQQVTDSVLLTIRRIEDIRRKLLAEVTASTDDNGSKARRFGAILITFVLISGAVLFWFIINTIRTQNSLIRQLNISERKVKEAAAVKEKFLANMSHEIRTPLNAILGFTGLLQKKELDSESAQHVQTIHQSGENLLSIVNDILDLSKIEAGMMRIESVPFSIREVMQATEKMFRAKADEKGLQLVFDTDDSLPGTVEGDPVRLTQILVNLAGNALKFTGEGSIDVSITNNGIENGILRTGIMVRDTGIGIDKEKLNAVFERFQQAEDAVTRSYGGTGLGLSIVKELVFMQQGTIAAESEPGKGTVFQLMIPYKVLNDVMPVPSPVPGKSKTVPATDRVILVAEDNEVNQVLVGHLLSSWKIRFDVVSNGRAAIDALRSKKYDLVLMDIQMPEMDGYTAAQQIRKKLKLDMPIIAMTAHAFTGEKEKCLSYGMNEYLSKPIDEALLHGLIGRFIELEQHPQKEKAVNGPWQHIDLQYMKDVSGGNREYERTVTEQFIEMLPAEVQMLEQAWLSNNIPHLQRTAHSMKTTVSVMGLGKPLQPYLDALEQGPLNEERFRQNYAALNKICTAALEEARQLVQQYNKP